jgi:hypothetical protein
MLVAGFNIRGIGKKDFDTFLSPLCCDALDDLVIGLPKFG